MRNSVIDIYVNSKGHRIYKTFNGEYLEYCNLSQMQRSDTLLLKRELEK